MSYKGDLHRTILSMREVICNYPPFPYLYWDKFAVMRFLEKRGLDIKNLS